MSKFKKRKIKCIVCDKLVEGSFSETRKYCSRDCFNKKRPHMVKHPYHTKKCEECSTEFETNIETQIYCSSDCYNNVRGRQIEELECVVCKTKFKKQKKRGTRRTCSIECRSKDPIWIKAQIQRNFDQLHKTELNKLEIIGGNLLREMDIKFEEQVLLCDKYVVDVFIPEHNTVIQWDGDYWHGHPNNLKNGIPNKLQESNMKKDIRVNENLIKNGYTVLRFWQKDVYENPNLVKEQIQNIL